MPLLLTPLLQCVINAASFHDFTLCVRLKMTHTLIHIYITTTNDYALKHYALTALYTVTVVTVAGPKSNWRLSLQCSFQTSKIVSAL